MFRKPIAWYWHLILGAAGVAFILGAYDQYARKRQRADPKDRAAPTLAQVSREMGVALTPDRQRGVYPQMTEPRIWVDMRATYTRLFVGFGVTALIAVAVGLLMGCYSPVEAVCLPPLAFFSKIPGTALLTVIAAMVGLKFRAYGVMIFFGIFPTLAQAYCHAAKEDVPEELLFKARTLGASQFACIRSVILPHIMPKIVEGIRLSFGMALVYLIALEFMWTQDNVGVGYVVRQYSMRGTEGVTLCFCYLACLGFAGLVIDGSLQWLRRRLFPWYQQ